MFQHPKRSALVTAWRRSRMLFVAAAIACVGAGCGQKGGDPANPSAAHSKAPETLIFARGSDAQKLDPADIDDGESVNTLSQICEGLVRFRSGTLEIEPGLAETYNISPDGLTYTFHLRSGVKFHDGTPLNAETAIWSFQRQMYPEHPGHLPEAAFAYWTYLYQDIVDVRAADAMTVEFRLKQANAGLLASLAVFPAFLLSPNALAKYGDEFQRNPVGTGPYRFVKWTPNQTIVMEANPEYWDKAQPPRFRRLVMKVVPENSVRVLELKSGTIHGLDGLQPAELPALAADRNIAVHRDTGLNVGYLTFNLNHERYRDPEVRLAFALALDRTQLVQLALDGAGSVAHYPLPPSFQGYPAKPDEIPHNPARAREIISRHAAAFSAPVRLHVMNAPRQYFPSPERAASIVRSDLEAVGLKVEIVTRDFQSHLHDLRNFDFDIAIIGWVGDNGDTDNFLSVFFASWSAEKGAATNYANYRNPQMDELLLAARRAIVPAQRAKTYEDALAVWRRDLPLIPLVHGDNIVVTRRELTGFQIQKIGDLRLGPVGWRSE
jgi:peptide/nickel transport system substrate-binding protein